MLLDNLFNVISKYHHKRIANFVKKLDINLIIDVGAHKGEFTNHFLNIKKIKKFYCFEPQSTIYKILLSKFKKIDKIKTFNVALDRNIKKKKIYINSLSQSSTLSKFNKKSFYLKFKNFLTGQKKNFRESYTIKTNTIDNLFQKKRLSKTLLKIDVEGYEYNVLKGAKKKLKSIPIVVIEHQFGNHYKNSDFSSVHKFLLDNNFQVLKNFYFPTFHYKDVLYYKTSKKINKKI